MHAISDQLKPAMSACIPAEARGGKPKIEGSIVNWLNGPLFQMVGERLGFHAALEPFTHREGSNIVVLTARRRDASSDERLLASDEELLSARAAA